MREVLKNLIIAGIILAGIYLAVCIMEGAMNKAKAAHEKKSKKIEILATETQSEEIKRRATQHNMSVSEFGLFCCLNARIEASIGVKDRLLDDINHLNLMYKQGMLKEHEFAKAKERILSEV